jgi:hypothetical protein
LAELSRMRNLQQVLSDAQAFTEAVVAGSAGVARTLHFGIASVPFGLLEALPLTRGTTRAVRDTHDLIAGTVYDAIHGVNRAVGQVARTAIGSSGEDQKK